MTLLLHNLILLFFFIYLTFSTFNSKPTYSGLALSSVNGTAVEISDDQTTIISGFSDGTIKIFTTQVNQICSNISTTGSRIIQFVWLPSFGPVSLDQNDKVTLWSTQCQVTNQIQFNQTATKINFYQTTDQNSTTIGLVAVNLEDRIEEYNIQTGQLNLVYDIPSGQKCYEMIYNPDGDGTVLLASTNASKIIKFQTNNGTIVQQYAIQSPIQKMVKISVITGDVVIGVAQNNDVIRFDSTGQILDRGTYAEATGIAICPTTKQFTLSFAESISIGLYLYAGNLQQTITQINGYPQDIDCAATYLVSIDDQGYINVFTYEAFKSWIIGLIAGIGGGLAALVIGIIIFIMVRRKWARQASQGKYAQNKPKKYPRNKQNKAKKIESMQMLSTLQTSMRE